MKLDSEINIFFWQIVRRWGIMNPAACVLLGKYIALENSWMMTQNTQ